MLSPAGPPCRVRFGAYELDATSGELRKHGVALKIHPQPLRVLQLLVERRGQIVTREEIQHALWGKDTFVDFDRGINFCVNQIRAALLDDAEHPRYIETLPRRGYRFIAPITPGFEAALGVTPLPDRTTGQSVDKGNGTEQASVKFEVDVVPVPVVPVLVAEGREKGRGRLLRRGVYVAAACFLVVIAGFSYFRPRNVPKLTEKDVIVIGDFRNNTGDPVFDEALKQGLNMDLGQSPFLILSERKMSQTLQMMERGAGTPIIGDVAREVCIRSGSTALVNGEIARLGDHYVVGLDVVLCGRGDTLARERVIALRREDVLSALNGAASRIRARLGESLPNVKKYNVPVQVTTNSLEALSSFGLALTAKRRQGEFAAIPLLQRAVELDPNFAMAYTHLAREYNNLDEPSLAIEYARKAYRLREQLTERERLWIEISYFKVTGQSEKLEEAFASWNANYPRELVQVSQGISYEYEGQYQQAVMEQQAALQLDSDSVVTYEDLGGNLIALNRFVEAKAIYDKASQRNLDSMGLHWMRYYLAFLQGDSGEMEHQVSVVAGKPGAEDRLLAAQSDTEAYYGRLKQARIFSKRAVESARRADLKEVAGMWQALAALREAEFGELAPARGDAIRALAISQGRNVQMFAGLALARAGDLAEATRVVDRLEKDNPLNTPLKISRLPVLRAAIELGKRNLPQALELLEVARPYELGQPPPLPFATLYAPYIRGELFLAEHRGLLAEKEFRKILDHPGIALNFPIAALAHLQTARAYAMEGQKNKALEEYEFFLTLWKNADVGIPLLHRAKTEYARLKRSAYNDARNPHPRVVSKPSGADTSSSSVS